MCNANFINLITFPYSDQLNLEQKKSLSQKVTQMGFIFLCVLKLAARIIGYKFIIFNN